jgi:hypothetical protein
VSAEAGLRIVSTGADFATLEKDPGRAVKEAQALGMIDIPGILAAANKQGVKYHFIEDEHPRAEDQIPRSLKYLASLR